MNQLYVLSIIADVAIWAGMIVPILFFIQYTFLAKWWKNAVGRSIVALDLSLELVFAPLAVSLAWPDWWFIHSIYYTYMVDIAILMVSVVAAYRMIGWEKLRRARKFSNGSDKFIRHAERER